MDNDLQSQPLQLEDGGAIPLSSDRNAVDPSGFIVKFPEKYFGELIIAGAAYDAPYEHHEAYLAQALFYDRTQPVIVNGDTIAYRALDAGEVGVDDILLDSSMKIITDPNMVDDTVGIQYALLERDGVGGSGFQYYGHHTYLWISTGSPELLPFTKAIVSPAQLHVTSPTARDLVSLSNNLRVTWDGGGAAVMIVVSDVVAGQRPKPIIRMRLPNNIGTAVIPSTILQLLPKDRKKFLFTFSSANTSVTRVTGFQDNVLLQAEYNHNLLLYTIE